MKAQNLKREIIKRGGTAEIVTETVRNFRNEPWKKTTLKGTLNGYDIEMSCNNGTEFTGGNDYFTARRISNRNYFDAGSDYNPGGYSFYNRIKELDWIN